MPIKSPESVAQNLNRNPAQAQPETEVTPAQRARCVSMMLWRRAQLIIHL